MYYFTKTLKGSLLLFLRIKSKRNFVHHSSDLNIYVVSKNGSDYDILEQLQDIFNNNIKIPFKINFTRDDYIDDDFRKTIKSHSIPYNWQTAKLGDVCDVRDGTHDSPKRQDKGKYLITSKHLKDTYIDFETAYKIKIEDYDKINLRSKVNIDDILISMIGTIGKIFLVTKEPNFAIKNIGLIKNSNNIFNMLVLYYQMKIILNSGVIQAVLNGSTQKFLSLTNLRNLQIIVPPLQEQENIANVLNSFDTYMENLQQQNTAFEDLAKNIFKKIFSHNPQKHTWPQQTIGDLGKVICGKTPPTKNSKSLLIA